MSITPFDIDNTIYIDYYTKYKDFLHPYCDEIDNNIIDNENNGILLCTPKIIAKGLIINEISKNPVTPSTVDPDHKKIVLDRKYSSQFTDDFSRLRKLSYSLSGSENNIDKQLKGIETNIKNIELETNKNTELNKNQSNHEKTPSLSISVKYNFNNDNELNEMKLSPKIVEVVDDENNKPKESDNKLSTFNDKRASTTESISNVQVQLSPNLPSPQILVKESNIYIDENKLEQSSRKSTSRYSSSQKSVSEKVLQCDQYVNFIHDVTTRFNRPYIMNDHRTDRCCSADSLKKYPIVHSACENMGNRRYMEDRHRIEYSDPHLNVYYAVHDGHVGSHAAEFISQLCHHEISHRISLLDDTATSEHIADAMALAFESLDYTFLSFARVNLWHDGCTTVIVMIKNDNIICANIGDSRAVLSRHRKAVNLSLDHKPDRDCEESRISALGGEVRCSRTEEVFCCYTWNYEYGPKRLFPGGIAVSRGFGDLNVKEPASGLVETEGLFVSHPEISITPISLFDEFICLASDGLWDVFSSQDAVDFIHIELEKSTPLPDIVEKIIAQAQEEGSGDNITVIIALFQKNPIESLSLHSSNKTTLMNVLDENEFSKIPGQPSPAM